MTLTAPVAMSVVGDALAVRHLRAGGVSYAVWLINDDGGGERFVVRQRTGAITLLATLRTDGTDFNERVIPLPPTRVVSYHAIESSAGVATFLYSDGLTLKAFTWDAATNVVLSPPTELAQGNLPSQFDVSGVLRQLYVRDREVKVRVGGGSEIGIINHSASEARDIDVVRKALSANARYAGQQSVNRELALPFLVEASTVLLYDGAVDAVSVTEALPPGVVSYWTFDAADFSGNTILDQVGANNGSPVGTPATNVPAGQVGQARQFTAGIGNDYYNLGNPVNLRLTGDMSLAFWIKRTTMQDYYHPVHKGYGGEFGTIIRGVSDEGRFDYYYGTNGADGTPCQEIASPDGVVPMNIWTHLAAVRDLTNGVVRLFVNGQIVTQKAAMFAVAASGSNSVLIGGAPTWTGRRLAAQLDEMLLANQAWSPQSVAALYAKGIGGVRASVSGSGSQPRLRDSGPGARHAILSPRAIPSLRGRTVNGIGGNAAHAFGLAGAGSSALTIEARLYPKSLFSDETSIVSNRVDLRSSTAGTRNQGAVELSYTVDGLLRFRFDTVSATVELHQTGGERLRFNALNHVALSHTFGDGGSSFIAVNGSQVPAVWVGGGGSETPTPLSSASSFNLSPGDEIAGLRVSSVAKTITQIRDYLRGRS